MTDCLIVAAGGAIGAVCRFLIGKLPIGSSDEFPIKTFIVNNNIGGQMTSVLVHGFAYGTLTNVPQGFTGNFTFIAIQINNVSNSIRVFNIDQMIKGEVQYNPD